MNARKKLKTMRKHSGFTIIELLIVIAIMAVMTAIAVPNFLSWIPEKRLFQAGDDVFSNIQYAKMQAIKNNESWGVEFLPGSNTYRVVSDVGGANSVEKTVDLADYGSGVAFGAGNATREIPSSDPIEADGVDYFENKVVFTARGMVDQDYLGYVYITNEFGSAVAAGTPAMSGVVIQRVWSGSAWQ